MVKDIVILRGKFRINEKIIEQILENDKINIGSMGV